MKMIKEFTGNLAWEILVQILFFSPDGLRQFKGNLALELLVQILLCSYENDKEFKESMTLCSAGPRIHEPVNPESVNL